MDWQTAISLVSAAVAVGAAIISFVNARHSLTMGLFDRRMAVYREFRLGVASCYDLKELKAQGTAHFHRALVDAQFLFGPEVVALLSKTLTTASRFVAQQERNLTVPKNSKQMFDSFHYLTHEAPNELHRLLAHYVKMDQKLPWPSRVMQSIMRRKSVPATTEEEFNKNSPTPPVALNG